MPHHRPPLAAPSRGLFAPQEGVAQTKAFQSEVLRQSDEEDGEEAESGAGGGGSSGGPARTSSTTADALPGREIWVKYNVLNLYNVDTREQTFEARLNLEFTWEEPALNGHDPDKPIDWEAVWRPRRIELLNGHDVKYEPTYELCTWETRPSGNAVVTCYATAYGVSATACCRAALSSTAVGSQRSSCLPCRCSMRSLSFRPSPSTTKTARSPCCCTRAPSDSPTAATLCESPPSRRARSC